MANILAEQWLHPDNYNFWSSEWGGLAIKALGVLLLVLLGRWAWPKIWRHFFECDVEAPENCHRRGYRVHGTGHRACGGHHPRRHDKEKSLTTVDDILGHHEAATASVLPDVVRSLDSLHRKHDELAEKAKKWDRTVYR